MPGRGLLLVWSHLDGGLRCTNDFRDLEMPKQSSVLPCGRGFEGRSVLWAFPILTGRFVRW